MPELIGHTLDALKPIGGVYGPGDPNVLTSGEASSLGLATRFAVLPLQRLRITEIRRSGEDLVLRFTSVTNKTYGVQFKADLSDPTWTALPGTVSGAISNTTWVVSGGALVAPRFYRVIGDTQ